MREYLNVKTQLFMLLGLTTVGSQLQGQSIARDPGPRGGPPGIGGPITGLTPAQLSAFLDGKAKFEEEEDVQGPNAGLGPRFNSDSCVSCHSHPATGGTAPPVNPLIAIATKRGARNGIPPFITASGPIREARLKCTTNDSARCGVLNLFTISGRPDAVGCEISQPDFAALQAAGLLTFRIPTLTVGLGFVENILDVTIRDNVDADAAKKKALGIAGLPARNSNDGTITRFGWKAQNKSLIIFAAEAYNVEMGVTNELFPQERAESSGSSGACFFNLLPEDHKRLDATKVGEATTDIERFTNFMRLSAPPQPAQDTPSIKNGRLLFSSTGCALCHTPTLRTSSHSTVAALNNKDVNLFSDLALHDMGTGLEDDIEQGLAHATVFRTALLWGLGQKIFFLHDGRTKDLIEAIQAHASPDSEANKVVSNFNSLAESAKQDLINFLRSL